ncbi:cilia- and flagella-associated protein 68 [Caloenas nicobarica]|uniref:cilia- and flagella-associated protein 68 n=1 Tax=Caloenas nicobarica TaxID=187106 RepID=UPI0032B831AD
MHATGCGELWMDWDSTSKFSQYGWRCTTNENGSDQEPRWFPGHHPELHPPLFNPAAQSSCTIDYRPPYGSICLCPALRDEQEGYRKSNRDGKNLQTMPSEKQEACPLAVLQGCSSSKKTCHILKPNVASCEKPSPCFLCCIFCNLRVYLSFALCVEMTASHQSPCALSVKPH